MYALSILCTADVCTSDPMYSRCIHFRSYVKQMYALPILCKADVCTSDPMLSRCMHFSPLPHLPLNHLPPNPFKPHTHPLSTATLPLPALPQLPERFPSLPLVCARSKKSLPDSARPTSGPAYACASAAASVPHPLAPCPSSAPSASPPSPGGLETLWSGHPQL